MSKITMNSITNDAFVVNAAGDAQRADIIKAGRILTYEHAMKGHRALNAARGLRDDGTVSMDAAKYREMNARFQNDMLVYAAGRVCNLSGEKAPANLDEFRAQSMKWYGDANLYRVLQGIMTEIVTPILPAVISDAVSLFADMVYVPFGQTHEIVIGSNDIPVFQDSAWGASRSVPRNRFYDKSVTVNPTPRTCQINGKWTQLVANGTDFGQYFANIGAGMYAKIMGLWNAAMTAAASNTALIPSGLTYAFNNANWVTLANKIAAVNSTGIGNVFAYGGALALSKVLPTNATGSTNTAMDAALAEILGADYTRSGYMGEFMGVLLRPLTDAIVPGTQNTTVDTLLDQTKIWMMAGNGRRPMTIGMIEGTPIEIEVDPTKAGDMEMAYNITTAIDCVSVFSSKIGLITIA